MNAKLKPVRPDEEQAEEIAIEILLHMSNKLDLMGRFLSMSGIKADEVRDLIGHRSFYAGLFAFIVNHEPDLLEFCAARGIAPEWALLCYEQFSGEAVPWA